MRNGNNERFLDLILIKNIDKSTLITDENWWLLKLNTYKTILYMRFIGLPTVINIFVRPS